MNKKNTKLIKTTNISLLVRREIIKLQTKIQITHQHNKSKLNNTYRIKEINVKGKI